MLESNFIKNWEKTRETKFYTIGESEVFNYKDYEITVCSSSIKGEELKFILVLREFEDLEDQDIKVICEHFLGTNYKLNFLMGGIALNAWKC